MLNTRYYILNTKKGFTLIELLIVIGIIGILAGVIIAVINPQRQRERAKDAILFTQIEKFDMLMEAEYNSNLAYPVSCAYFRDTILAGSIFTVTCIGAGYGDITAISGVALPSKCLAAPLNYARSPTGTNPCVVRFYLSYPGQWYDGCVWVSKFDGWSYIYAKYGKVGESPSYAAGGCQSVTSR